MPARAEPKLTDEARAFVVQSLAMFDPPSVVAKAVKQEFDLTITPQGCEAYNPTKRAGARSAEKWKALFYETRKAFLENTAEIGISHRTVRLRALQRMVDKAESAGNVALAAQLLKQAAEEMGGAYTNRRELSGPDGAPIPVDNKVDVSRLTPEQLRTLASVRIRSDG